MTDAPPIVEPLEAPPRVAGSDFNIEAPPVVSLPTSEVQRQLGTLRDDFSWQRRQRAQNFFVFAAVPGWMISAIAHLGLMILLGLYLVAEEQGGRHINLDISQGPDPVQHEQLSMDMEPLEVEPPPPDLGEQLPLEIPAEADETLTHTLDEMLQSAPAAPALPAVNLTPVDNPGFTAAGRSDGLPSRSRRRSQALSLGATPQSERAVDLALVWIANHQRPDRGWSFDHRRAAHCSDDRCLCRNPGNYGQTENAATAMAVLAFLGAGNTHLQGPYRQQVADGLQYLLSRQAGDGRLMDGGNMYSHGLATLAMCEALAMTRYQNPSRATAENPDSLPPLFPEDLTGINLRVGAQAAVMFIEQAQHRKGGWRYQPRTPGDVSVLGWQLMALKSGYLAGLDVDGKVLKRAVLFLDQTSQDAMGSIYGYTGGSRRQSVAEDVAIGATTPIGLLCRMYTGWNRRQTGLSVGANRILRHARPNQGMYFYYYGTQVMHHYGGPSWEKWNLWMREYLVATQSDTGSERGSWMFTGRFDNAGRLYCTAMAAMTLEIYYRYSPIYGSESVGLQ